MVGNFETGCFAAQAVQRTEKQNLKNQAVFPRQQSCLKHRNYVKVPASITGFPKPLWHLRINQQLASD